MSAVAVEASEPAPFLLLPYQQRWVGDRSEVKVSEKSRRIGISWATAAEAVLEAAQEKGSGQDVWYTGYTQELALEFINDVADWTRKLGPVVEHLTDLDADEVDGELDEVQGLDPVVKQCLVRDEGVDIQVFRIRYASGFRVSAMTSAPRNFRGKQGYAIIDEAAFHDDLPGMMKAAMAFLMWGGRVAIISTHNGTENPFNELVEDCKAKELPYSLHRTTLDDAVQEGLYRRICLVRGLPWSAKGQRDWRQHIIDHYGDGADEELFCKPAKDGATYISGSLVEHCMYTAPVLRLSRDTDFELLAEAERHKDVEQWCRGELLQLLRALPKDRVHYLGEDFGRVSDLSVFAPVTLEQDLVRTVPFLVELRKIPHKQQEQVLFYILDRLPKFAKACMDGGGNGSYLAEQAKLKYRSRVEVVDITRGWYVEHLPPFRRAFEDELLRVPRDADVKADLQAFRRLNGVPKLPDIRKKAQADQLPRHGDAGIALVMAYVASGYGAPKTDYRKGNESSQGRRVRSGRGLKRMKGFL